MLGVHFLGAPYKKNLDRFGVCIGPLIVANSDMTMTQCLHSSGGATGTGLGVLGTTSRTAQKQGSGAAEPIVPKLPFATAAQADGGIETKTACAAWHSAAALHTVQC